MLNRLLVRMVVFFYCWRDARRQRLGISIWKCYRDGGGGEIKTPRLMRERQAIRWLRETADAEIFYIDRDYHFLFYRPR